MTNINNRVSADIINKLKYVLITPAKNEELNIEKTIQSMVSQTVKPEKWVIVSDGSTDKTDDIVRKYMDNNNWIHLLRMPENRDRNFAAKVVCFDAGYQEVGKLDYDIIGNLDADTSFDEKHFEFLLEKFAEIPELGVAGTPFFEEDFQYNYNYVSIEHVWGGCQLFRRECYKEIGGYIPIKGGGIDLVAVITARMKGWKTRTFTEKIINHHRKMGTGKSRILAAKFRFGIEDYYLGGHPLWEILRCIYQMKSSPIILGGLAIYLGYLYAFISRQNRPITNEFVKFRRKEQMHRLNAILFGNKQAH